MYSTLNSFSSIHTKQLKYVTPSVKSIAVGTTKVLSPVGAYHGGQHRNFFANGGMSDDGQFIILIPGNSPASTWPTVFSTDAGATWQVFNVIYLNYTLPNYNLSLNNARNPDRMISTNKQVIFLGKYLTNNGGTTWTTISTASSWFTMSSDGTYLYYIAGASNLYRSTNSGTSFTQLTGASINLGIGFPANSDRPFRCLSVSRNGQIVCVGDSSALASGGGLYVSTDYGSTFTLKNSTYLVSSNAQVCWVTASNSGTIYYYPAGTVVYVSLDYGTTFTSINTISNAIPIHPTNDGTTAIWGATNTGTYLYTTNSGTTNTSYSASFIGGSRTNWLTNEDNTFVINQSYPSSYLPSLFTKTLNDFKTVNFAGPSQLERNGMMGPQATSNCVSMSSSGQYILVGVNTGAPLNFLSLSTNYGVSWINLNFNNPSGGWPLATTAGVFPSTSYIWNCTAISGTGQIMVACSQATTAYVFLSTNYGSYFNKISGPGNTNGLPTALTSTWSSCAISSNGNVILLTANGLSAYLSTNSGTSFTTLGTGNGLPATNTWNYCAISYTNGQYMLLSANTGLYLSTNTGTSWSLIDGATNTIGLPTTVSAFTSMSISNSGSTMIAVKSGVYYSTNYGANWTRLDGTGNTTGLPTATSSSFVITGMSGDGTKILTGITSGAGYLSTNGGTSFTQINSTTSRNGLLPLATFGWGQMIVSNNGNTFYVNTGYGLCFCYDGLANYWCSTNWAVDRYCPQSGYGSLMYVIGSYAVVKFSGDGAIVLGALGGYQSSNGCTLTISYDGGYTFNYIAYRGQLSYTTTAPGQYFNIVWTAGSISYTGQYMILASSGNANVYITSNYGLTWLSISGTLAAAAAISTGLPATAQSWSCSALSSNGAVSILGISAGALYLSTNSFVTYSTISGTTSQFTSNGLPITNQNWNKLECSFDGSVILASINSGALYLTTNTGTSWTAIGGTTNSVGLPTTATPWSAIAVSGTNGQYMLAAANSGGLYLSTNKGTSWTQLSGTTNSYSLPTVASAWTCCAISQDGLIMAAAINNGYLYYSTNSGTTWTNYVYPHKCATQNFPWNSISMTADGSKAFATLSGADYFIITFTKQY